MNYGSRRLGRKEDESPPSATKQKSQPQWLAFLVDYVTGESNFYRSYARLLRGVQYFANKGIYVTLYGIKYESFPTLQVVKEGKSKKSKK